MKVKEYELLKEILFSEKLIDDSDLDIKYKDLLKKYYIDKWDIERIVNHYDYTRETIRYRLNNARNRYLRWIKNIPQLRLVYVENTILKWQIERLKRIIEEIHIKTILPNEKKTEILQLKVYELGLSVRTQNCLNMANIKTVEDLLKYNKSDFLRFRGFGKKSLQEIEELYIKYGL